MSIQFTPHFLRQIAVRVFEQKYGFAPQFEHIKILNHSKAQNGWIIFNLSTGCAYASVRYTIAVQYVDFEGTALVQWETGRVDRIEQN